MTPEDSNGSARMEDHEHESGLGGLADTATQGARSIAEQGKESTAQQMGNVASAIRNAAQELEQQMPKGAEIIRSAADTLQSGAERLRQRNVDEWVQGFRRFAHDEPAALFGGAMVAGFALARFLNSSRSGARLTGNSSAPRAADRS